MKRLALGFFAFLALGYIALCLIVYAKLRSLIYVPSARVPLTTDTLTLEVPGALLRISVRPQSVPGAVIYFGGNAEAVSDSMAVLGQAFPQHALYALNYRSYGGSTGSPSESALFSDGLALFDLVAAQHSQITVIGRSLGSGVAVRVASERPTSRLVLVTPYDSLADVAAVTLPYLPVRLLLRDRFDSYRYAPAVKAPTTIVVAGQDEIIPASSSQRLATRFAAGLVSYQVIDGARHNSISSSPQYAALLHGAP